MAKKDLNQIATSVLRLTTGQRPPEPTKNAAAVALGRLGGLKGGNARAKALSKEQKSAIAREAAKARWNRKARPSDE